MESEQRSNRETLAGQRVGPYEVERLVGRGGMGEVYLGRDTRLNRQVAIKSMHQRNVGDDEARRRFVRETRLASKVVHPYVATVFDVIEPDDEIFLVMEYIEGDTLRTLMRRRELDRDRVTELGVEMAEALTAIHREGLVHRDLKPGNVMITREGHAKVMDFGVARRSQADIDLDTAPTVTGENTLTGQGVGVGTVQYMSPEQLRGEPVEPSSDLFSMGIVMYEAITGEHPFERATLMDTVSAILNEPPGGGEEPSTLSRSGPLRQIINNLLQKDVTRRYPSAERLAEDLRLVSRGKLPDWQPTEKPKRKNRVVASVAAAAVLAAAGAWYFWPGRSTERATAGIAVRPVIAVMPFEDRTGDSDGDNRGAMVADLLAADLSESSLVRGMESERLERIIAGGEPAASPRDRVDRLVAAGPARWIVAASLWREGDVYEASADVYDARDPDEPISSFRVAAAGTGTLVDLASVELLGLLFPGAAADAVATPDVATSTSRSDEARLLEFRARQALGELRYRDAIELFEGALAIDPTFILARSRLAIALHYAGYGKRAIEEIGAASRQLEQDPTLLADRAVFEIRAIEARLGGRNEVEVEQLRALVAEYADEPALRLALSGALDRAGHPEEALRETSSALELDGAFAPARVENARLLVKLDRVDEAKADLDRADELFLALDSTAGRARVAELRAWVSGRDRDLDRARELFAQSAEDYREAGLELRAASADAEIGSCDLAQGQLAAARSRFEPLLDVYRAAGHYQALVSTLDRLGAQHYASGEFEAAEAFLLQALDEGRPLDNPSLLLSPSLNLASLMGYTGRLGTASSLARESLQVARKEGNSYMEEMALVFLADVEFQQGHMEGAIGGYEDLIELNRSPRGSGRSLTNSLTNMAWVLEQAGRIGEALESIDQAIDLSRQRDLKTELAYQLRRRADVRGHLGLWDEATADMAEARQIAEAEVTALPDLVPRLDLVRGRLLLRRGETEDAASALAPALQVASGSSAVALEVPLLTAACDLALLQGKPAEALRRCRTAVAHPKALAFERTQARCSLADALAAVGRAEESKETALRALEEAESFGLPLAGARAAATLVRSGGPDRDALLQRGRALLDVYLEGLPTADRERALGRADLIPIVSVLGTDGATGTAAPSRS